MKRVMKCTIPAYHAPAVRIVPLRIERGFAASLENPVTDPEIDW